MKAARLFPFPVCFAFVLSLAIFLPGKEPVSSQPRLGWETTYQLSNEVLEVVVAPRAGRMVHFSARGGENLFTRNAAIAGETPEEAGADWLNHGGDWFWPVHQSRWEGIGGTEWPPPQVMEGSDWHAEAWREEDGGMNVVLRRALGAPVFIAVERHFYLPPGDVPEVRVRQSVRRVNASEVPVCLWQISQMDAPDEVMLGVVEGSPFPGGIRHIGFDPVPDALTTRCDNGVAYRFAEGTEHKVGSDARWIAARRGDEALLQWTEGGRGGGDLPDGGCGVVSYANAGLGYAEIETQSAEVDLAPGEVLENEVVYRWSRVTEEMDSCGWVGALAAMAPQSGRVRFTPGDPVLGDRVRIEVRNPEGGGMLHWGVNGPQGDWALPEKGYWPEGSVPGESGVAVDTPLPPPVDGVSTLELGPFDDPAQVVESLHVALRWGDEWDSNEGVNYNVEFSAHPDAPRIAWEDLPEEVNGRLVVGISTDPEADRLHLHLPGGEEPVTTGGGRLQTLLTTEDWSYGARRLTAKAERDGHLAVSSREVWKLPELEPGPDLPASHPYGAVRVEEEVGLHLLAPNARFVEVEWRTEDGLERKWMQPVDGGRWFLSVPWSSEEPFFYRYVVDGSKRFADPWSRVVDWRTPGTGRESARPEDAWSVVGRLPPSPGSWTPPAPETWVIYELSIPDVAPPGSYKGLEAKLDEIAELGINAIEPLPVTAFPGAESWGYNPAFHMAPEGAYGPPEDLASLIRATRARGIAYVKDIVLNHVDATGPLHAMHGPAEINPFTVPFEGFNWGFPKLDQESEAFKRYVRDTLTHWVTHWGVDGFRYDATQWIQWSGYKDWGASWMAYVVEEANPDVIQIAENLPSEPNMVKGTALDGEWDGHYRWRMRNVMVEGRIAEPEKFREILDPRSHAYQTGWQRMPYIESHDEERFVRELLQAGYGEEEALRRHHAAAAVTLTVPGIPMLYAGQEWGESTKKVVGLNPLKWERAERPARAALRDRFGELIRLRTGHRALHHDRIDLLRVDAATGTVVYRRPGVPESILVALNVSAHPITLDLSETGRLVGEVHRAGAEEVTLGEVRLRAGEARVFRIEP